MKSNQEHECNFVEEQEPESRLILGPCIECGIPALEAIKQADAKIKALEQKLSFTENATDVSELSRKLVEKNERIEELEKRVEEINKYSWCGSNDLVCGKAWKEERDKLKSRLQAAEKVVEASRKMNDYLYFKHMHLPEEDSLKALMNAWKPLTEALAQWEKGKEG